MRSATSSVILAGFFLAAGLRFGRDCSASFASRFSQVCRLLRLRTLYTVEAETLMPSEFSAGMRRLAPDSGCYNDSSTMRASIPGVILDKILFLIFGFAICFLFGSHKKLLYRLVLSRLETALTTINRRSVSRAGHCVGPGGRGGPPYFQLDLIAAGSRSHHDIMKMWERLPAAQLHGFLAMRYHLCLPR